MFDGLYRAGEIELELVPQGNLAERIRAAGAGIGAFFSPTGVGTQLAEGKEVRTIDGRDYVLEYPIRADVALISALRADRWGNLVYRRTARNFGPIMAAAAATTIAQVDQIVPLGDIDPETVVTPGPPEDPVNEGFVVVAALIGPAVTQVETVGDFEESSLVLPEAFLARADRAALLLVAWRGRCRRVRSGAGW